MIHLGGQVLAHDALAPLLVEVDQLRPHSENPKNGDTDAIVESIVVNGLYRPLYVTSDGTILAGNHTYHAALELGAEKLPIIRLDVDLDHARRILLGDNRISDLGRYDDALLLDLLDKLTETAGPNGLDGTGYSVDDQELLRLAQVPPLGETPGYLATGDLIIHGLPLSAIAAFRDLPGEDDRDRFLILVNEMLRDTVGADQQN
jgi:hypothetical protein